MYSRRSKPFGGCGPRSSSGSQARNASQAYTVTMANTTTITIFVRTCEADKDGATKTAVNIIGRTKKQYYVRHAGAGVNHARCTAVQWHRGYTRTTPRSRGTGSQWERVRRSNSSRRRWIL